MVWCSPLSPSRFICPLPFCHSTAGSVAQHNRMATIDGMWDRTITVGSGGKTFSVTGWKIGWAIGPKHLVTDVYLARQWTSFSVATPLQEAVAVAFEATALAAEGEPHAAYFDEYKADLQERRDKLVTYLSAAGLRPVVPSGSYFVLCDISGLGVDLSDGGRLEADDIDDADLEAELDMLGEGEFDMEDASYLDDATSAPAAPTAIPSDGAVADTSKVAVDEFGLPGTLA